MNRILVLSLLVALGWCSSAVADERPDSLVVEDAYRATLATWADGRFDHAVGALADLESRLAADEAAACLAWARRNTLEGLAREEPESLLPVLTLHVDTWLRHVREKRYAFALAATREALPGLELYAETGGEGAGEHAGRLLVHWAELLISSPYPEGADELLDAALVHAPELPEALLLRALLAERAWDYEVALPDLDRLLELRPEDDHARLRRGVNLARAGRFDDAVRDLGMVARGRGDAWMRVLAYEELARLASLHGRGDDAIALLQEALGQLPESEQLAVQLTYHLRRRDGRPSLLAGEVLNAFIADTGVAPRLRYEHEPRRLGELRPRLFAEVDRRRPLLAAALARLPRDDAGRPTSPVCRRKARWLE